MPTVWFRLVIGDNYMGDDDGIDVTSNDCTISAFRWAVKKEADPLLNHLSAMKLKVYPPGTVVPVPAGTVPCPVWEEVISDHPTALDNFYIVVAPSEQQSFPDIATLQANMGNMKIDKESGESQIVDAPSQQSPAALPMLGLDTAQAIHAETEAIVNAIKSENRARESQLASLAGE